MIGSNIKKYRLLSGLSMRDLASKINVSHQTIKKIEDGNITPNSNRLIQIAKALNVRISDLVYTYEVPSLKFVNFRKNTSLNKKKEDGLKMMIQSEISKYIDILNKANEMYSFDKNAWTFPVYTSNDLKEIAAKVRTKLGVSNDYSLDNLTDKLEDNNFLIVEINFDENFDGFCEYVGDLAFIILSSKGYERNRFTLAHELGHLILDFKEKLNDKQKEDYCNIFAACLLMPENAIKRELDYNNRIKHNISLNEIMYIAKEYKVSINAVIVRLFELKMINDNQKRNLFILLSKSGFKSKQLKIVNEDPIRKNKLIFRLEAENIISREEAIKYLGVSTNEYFEFNFGN